MTREVAAKSANPAHAENAETPAEERALFGVGSDFSKRKSDLKKHPSRNKFSLSLRNYLPDPPKKIMCPRGHPCPRRQA
jgi:hypothetical protein